jgi:DNA-binding beta-propeller fold protein YncE
VTDVGNRRVLQFLAADVATGPGPLQASLEIGQLNFTSIQNAVTNATRTKADAFAVPGGIALDSAGRLYVTDTEFSGDTATVSRVLVFTPPFSNGMAAARIMGVFSGNPPNQDAADKTWMFGAQGLFFIPGISKMGVVDTGSSRILLFDTFDKWPDQATVFSPLATGVVGQSDFRSRGRNASTGGHVAIATAQSLFGPTAVAFSGTELFVVDSGNHRVVVLPFASGTFGPATRVLGQDTFNGQAPNLVEGREFFFANNETGIAIDSSGDTPYLYVADSGNHRVLGFRDARKLQAGAKADLVIGQADFTTSICNFQGSIVRTPGISTARRNPACVLQRAW